MVSAATGQSRTCLLYTSDPTGPLPARKGTLAKEVPMFDFSIPIDRHGTWCTQWDYVADRFGVPDLLPFTISDMDFATAPCILDAVSRRLAHGVLGYSRWQNEAFLGAIAHWYASLSLIHI